LLILQSLPPQTVASKCGAHRSMIWRWKQKWDVLSANVQLTNDNRPSRSPGNNTFRLAAVKWAIPTNSSRPRTSPRAIAPAVINRVLALRASLKRCAEVIWYHLVHVDGIVVSLSSVRRILHRTGVAHGRKPRLKRDNPRRPPVTKPGELVQTDTVYYICPLTKRRRYVYTVIDLCGAPRSTTALAVGIYED